MSKPWKWVCAVVAGFGNVVVCIREHDADHYEYDNLTAIVTQRGPDRVQMGFEAWICGKVSLAKTRGLLRKDAVFVMSEASAEAQKQARNAWEEIVETEEGSGPTVVTPDQPEGRMAIQRAMAAVRKDKQQ